MIAIAKRAGRRALDDGITDAAAALAYYAFLALPATLLVAVGVFGLVAGEQAVDTVVDELGAVAPDEATTLVRESLARVTENSGGSVALVAVGLLVALWTTTGAMTALMRALNRVYGLRETRSFLRQRLTALALLAISLTGLGLVVGLLVLGPHVAEWVGDATGLERPVAWVWWTAQWPVLLLGLLAVFRAVLWLGPDAHRPRTPLVTPGAVLAVVAWLAVSGLFALYTSWFGSYNKVWGALAAVVVTLTWLWLGALALLAGAVLDAELARTKPAPRRSRFGQAGAEESGRGSLREAR